MTDHGSEQVPEQGASADAAPGQLTWEGGRFDDQIQCVLAPNPGPMTLDGTNTWILLPRGSSEAIVIDPGPDDESHLGAVVDVVRAQGATVGVTLLTHGHPDHHDGAGRFAELAGCPVRAADPELTIGPDEPLADGAVVRVGGIELNVLALPGHTSDSLGFLLAGERVLFVGDTVLGRGTSFVAHPDGALGPYLASLQRLRELAANAAVTTMLPGHGPVVTNPLEIVDYYLDHRAERLAQVRSAVAAGARTAGDVVSRVYADVDHLLWEAAERSVRAQMDYLASEVSGRDA